MDIDDNKTHWQIIEEKAREQEGVSNEFSLRYASLDHDKDKREYAKYRLRNLDTEEIRTGQIYV